jgi:hypothetical protein
MREIRMMPILTLTTQIKSQIIMKDFKNIMNCFKKIDKKYLRNMELLSKVRQKLKEKKGNSRDSKRKLKGNSKHSNVKDKSNKKREKLDKLK